MARLQPAEPHGLDLFRRITYAVARRMYGRPLEPTRTVAHHPKLLFGYGMIASALDRSSAVEAELKHLAMLRTGQLVGCEWCLDFGSYLAHRSGCPEEKLRELSTWRESERYSGLERLVLEYTEAMTRTPVEVSDELFGRLREHFDERQMVELTMAIAMENLYARSNWAFGLEGEGFSEGMYCVAPATDVAANAAAANGAPVAEPVGAG
jgi:AhpD family alkylhydroperoxidase